MHRYSLFAHPTHLVSLSCPPPSAPLQAAAAGQSSADGSAAQLAADKAAAEAAAEREAADVARLRRELAQLQRMMARDDAGAGGAAACRTSIADVSDPQVRPGVGGRGYREREMIHVMVNRRRGRQTLLRPPCSSCHRPRCRRALPRIPQIMEVKEQAERKIARLHTRIQQLESQANRLSADNESLAERLAEAQGAVAAAAAAVDAADEQGSSGAAELAAARQDRAGLEARCMQLESELRKSKRREEKLQVGRALWVPEQRRQSQSKRASQCNDRTRLLLPTHPPLLILLVSLPPCPPLLPAGPPVPPAGGPQGRRRRPSCPGL